MSAVGSTASKRSSYGLSFNDTTAFQHDSFLKPLGAVLSETSSSPVQLEQKSHVDSQSEPSEARAMSSTISSPKQQTSKQVKSRSGFFKRMLNKESVSKPAALYDYESTEKSATSDTTPMTLRHRASNLFKRSSSIEKPVVASVPSSPASNTATIPLALDHRLYSERDLRSSNTSLQERFDSDAQGHRKEPSQERVLSTQTSPVIDRRKNFNACEGTFKQTSSIVSSNGSALGTPALPQVEIPLVIAGLGPTTRPDSSPSLARDANLHVIRSDSPKRPRFWERTAEGAEKSNQEVELKTVQGVKAKSIYDCEDLSMRPEDYSAYLGKDDSFSAGVRYAFMELFDFTKVSIVNALRQMCGRLYIRGETQVIDRVIEAFAKRWRACNIAEKYLTHDVTYVIAFALMTLNTDLHTANLESDQRMKKSQFVQNTMQAIQVTRSENEGMVISSRRVDASSSVLSENQSIRVVHGASTTDTFRAALAVKEDDARTHDGLIRSGSVRKAHMDNIQRAAQLLIESRDAYLRTILEDFYVSIKTSQIQQPAFATKLLRSELVRTSSVASRASSLGGLFRRDVVESGRETPELSTNNSVASFDPTNDGAVSERSVSAYGRSVSMYNSQQSSRLSMASRASSTSRFSMRGIGNTRAIGFVGSLATAMIREEATSPVSNNFDAALDIQDKQDEELTLSGAPFAKEGRVRYKCQLASSSRRSKQRGWSSELFAVLEKGHLRIFDFSAKSTKTSGMGVGGGDWTENARSVADLDLVQSIAMNLPKEASTKQRPHVWQLTLANDDVHMFEVGTELLIHEWISTANYWASRVTKEPLLGAVDSSEYGWGKILDTAIDNENLEEGKADESAQRRPSQFSATTSGNRFDFIAAQFPGNKVFIAEWKPDTQFATASQMPPEEQLQALNKHLSKLRSDVTLHNSRREYISRAFSPKHANLAKAMSNFEKRSTYLHKEIFKYSSYVTALEVGIIRAKSVAISAAKAACPLASNADLEQHRRHISVDSEYSHT